MNILSKMPTGLGGNWILVEFENDFYGYGYEQELHSLTGFPVNQCGTKDEVLDHCKSIEKLCSKNIEKYQKEFEKGKNNGWELLIEHEKTELEMLTRFESILKENVI